MAVYRCGVCGHLFDEQKEGYSITELKECPMCHQPREKFIYVEDDRPEEEVPAQPAQKNLSYDPAIVRKDPDNRYMAEIHEMAVTGQSIHAAMSTRMPMQNRVDILLLSAPL